VFEQPQRGNPAAVRGGACIYVYGGESQPNGRAGQSGLGFQAPSHAGELAPGSLPCGREMGGLHAPGTLGGCPVHKRSPVARSIRALGPGDQSGRPPDETGQVRSAHSGQAPRWEGIAGGGCGIHGQVGFSAAMCCRSDDGRRACRLGGLRAHRTHSYSPTPCKQTGWQGSGLSPQPGLGRAPGLAHGAPAAAAQTRPMRRAVSAGRPGPTPAQQHWPSEATGQTAAGAQG
jgi:hypothetical protein